MIAGIIRILSVLLGLPGLIARHRRIARIKRLENNTVRAQATLKSTTKNLEAKIEALKAKERIQNEAKEKPVEDILDYLRRGGM